MTLAHSPSISTNGLILCIDAGNPRSYPGTGTACNDISGSGNNGTLVNGVSYSSSNLGTFVFDGIDDYINVSNPASLNPGINSFTIDAWVYQKDAGFNGIVEGRGANLHGILLILNYPSEGQASMFVNTTAESGQNIYTSTVSTFGNTSVWMNVTVVVDRSAETIVFYKNGVKQGNTVSITSGGTTDPGSGYIYHVGGDLGGAEANINLSLIKHYNRVLTAQEVENNFNAICGRYGI